MLAQAYSFRRLKGSLTATAQMLVHTLRHIPVDIPVGHA